MSAMNTHAPPGAGPREREREPVEETLAEFFFVPQAGPPVVLLLGPLFILVLLIIPPAAFLLTIVAVLFVVAVLLIALGALIASPYLLVQHLRHAEHRRRFAFAQRWLRAPVVGVRSLAAFASQAKGTT
jgi:hypothetical protein